MKIKKDATKKKKSGVEEKVVKKRKIAKEEPSPKKRSIAVLDLNKPAKISKLEKGIASIVGDSADQIQHLLETSQNDSAVNLMQKRVLQAVVDLIPYAESNVRGSQGARGVYAFNSLVTSIRELMSDLQATKDRGAIGAHMVEKVIRPAFLDIGMALAQEEQHLSTAIRDNTDKEQCAIIRAALRDSVQRMALTIQRKYEESKTGAISFLQS
jgi:hypothetical protein